MAHAINYNNTMVPMSVFADIPLHLAPEDYPNGAFGDLHSNYNAWWSHYKGYSLNRTGKGGIEVYPAKQNIIRPAVHNHSAVTLGQYEDKIVTFKIGDSEDIDPEVGKQAAKYANLLWAINGGDALLIEQVLMQQIFGGCFWNVAWTPTRKQWPIRYFVTDPRCCFPIWDGNDYDRLVAIDVQHQVPKALAKVRYRISEFHEQANQEFVEVHEHWDESSYWITIDGETGKWPDGSEMAGPNPFLDPILNVPIIPYIYAPRIRVGEWYGESLIPSLVGAQEETNNNLAHMSEGLADAMHLQKWVRNRSKGAQGLDKPRDEWLELGMAQLGEKQPPEVGVLDTADLTPPMVDLVMEKFPAMFRENSGMPNVGYGRVDSVKSALTMHYMMWPSTNIARQMRINMGAALKRLNYTAFVMALAKKPVEELTSGQMSVGIEVDEQMIEAILLAHTTHWPAMLPQDRVDLVAEMSTRVGSNLISRETAIRRLDGDNGIQEELDRIEEQVQAEQEKQLALAEQQSTLAQKDAEHGSELRKDEIKTKAKVTPVSNRQQAAGGRSKGKNQR